MATEDPKKTIHFIGGASGIPRWFIENVFRPDNYRIIIWDLPKQAAACIDACDLFVSTDSSETMQRGINEFTGNFGIIFGLPGKALEELYPLLAPHIPDNTPTLDLSSTFVVAEWFEKFNHRRFDTHSLHPMFGHLDTSPPGQTAIFRVDAPGTGLPPIFMDPIISSGIQIVSMTRRRHETAMQWVQVLTHFTALVAAQTMSDLGRLPSEFETVATPPYKLIATLITRIINGNPSTYAGIQETWEAKEIRNAFCAAAADMNRTFSNGQAQQVITELKQRWRGESEQWKETNALLISSLQVENARLHRMRKARQLAVVQYRNNFIVGWITSLAADHVEITDIGTPLPNGKLALTTTPVVAQFYRRNKYSVGEHVCRLLPRRDVQVLDDEAANRWIREHVQFLPHSFTVVTPQAHSPQAAFENVPAVQVTEFVGSYHDQPKARWKHTFRVLVDPRLAHSAALTQVQQRADALWVA